MSRIDDLIRQHCPNGVEFRALGEIGQFERGSGIQKSDFVESGIGCIHYGQIHTHYGTWATETKSFVSPELAARTRRAKTGDLVVATTSEDDEAVGKAVAWLGADEVAVSTDAFIFRHNLDPRYVSYFFETEHFHTQKRRHVTGTKVRRISGSALSKIRIPIPPLIVQREIVGVLDHFQSLAAELEAQLRAELIARQHQHLHYRAGLLDFSNGEDEVVWAPLSRVAHFVSGKAHESVVDPEGEISLLTSRFISTQGLGEHRVRRVKREDVRSPALRGQIALVMSDLPNGRALARAFFVDADDKYAANQRVCLLEARDTTWMLPRFLYSVVDRNPQLLAYNNGIDQTHLKRDQILGITIPIPPLREQVQVVTALERIDSLAKDLSHSLATEVSARRTQYEYYRDRLLTFEEAA